MTCCWSAAALSPRTDYDFLKKSGMAAIFGPGTPTAEIVNFIQSNVRQR